MDAIKPLPRDSQGILQLAARSMWDLFSTISQGMMLIDHEGYVVWINDGYKQFLQPLGFSKVEDFVGKPVDEVVPNTLMRHVLETGEAILIDLMSNQAGTFVVSRIPLRDDTGRLIGVIGMVLFDHPETTLKPLISKFARLQRDLEDAKRELASQRRSKYTLASFLGASPAAVDVKRQARRAAQSSSAVLLLGETGTGKELLAHAIHAASARVSGPFVSVNIAAIPDTLLEAEFFGVAPGAYTGADRKGRDGKFKLADSGTLLLDEIGDMPPQLQAKLLRALQEGEIEQLGSNKLIAFDARIIAATSRDLASLVREGKFRADLYYRLNVLPIRVPPLRERSADVALLAEVLCEEIAARNGLPMIELLPGAIALLAAQPWRGNIRELRNVLEQVAMRADSPRIDSALVLAVLQDTGANDINLSPVTFNKSATNADFAARATASHGGSATYADNTVAAVEPLATQLARVELTAITQALLHTNGNKAAAAKLLGIARATLYERLLRLSIN